jgi:hypothetical protein
MADFRLGRLKFSWKGNWTVNTPYVIDDIVKFGANTYVCIQNHTSVANETSFYITDLSKWSLQSEGIANKGEWQSGVYYKVNDIVKFGNTQYRVVTGFSTTGFTTANVTEYLSGFEYEDTWNSGETYQPGDVVTYGGYNYIATSINTNKPPAYNLSADWDILTTGFTAVGTYSTATDYKPGDLVQYGGYSYVAISTSKNVIPINTNSWSLIVKGFNWVGTWSSTTEYKLGDAVRKDSNSYVSVASTNINVDPVTDSLGQYWNSLIEGAETNVLTTQGDLVYEAGSGPARLPVGTNGQVLTVTSGGVPNWENNNVTHPVFYITEEGSDSNDGSNISRAFATLRHAVGIVTGPATIYMKAGTYEEQLPIIVPEEVSIVGDNIRTTKIRPAAGNSNIQVVRLASVPTQVTYGSTISNGAGTKVATVLDSNYAENVIHIHPETGGHWTTSDTWENGGTDIVITEVLAEPNNESSMFLLSNKTMLKDLVMEGLTGFIPAGIVTSTTSSINGTILSSPSGGLSPDLVGTTVTGAGVSAGTAVVNVTNSTTAEVSVSQILSPRTLTFTSLDSDINNATIKGVYVRLNPSSPITKSPYVSQCSSFSSSGHGFGGAVGAIVDGKVHRQFGDLSNRSMVFDSYTNIHDNGVGFWITNNAAAEFVSCFSYYAHISYASTRGGRIRSLAGNSSWGKYGIVSSGYNANENVIQGKVEGLVLEYDPETLNGSGFFDNERIKGLTSGAIGYVNNVQVSNNEIYYSLISAGSTVGVSSGFLPNEIIKGQTSGTEIQLVNNTDANRGQKKFVLVLSGISTTNLTPGGSIEFVTGSGNGGLNNQTITGADPFTYVIQTTSYEGPDGRGTVFINRGQLSSTGAGHTGGTLRIVDYPVSNTTTTFSGSVSISTTIVPVTSIAGLTIGGYLLTNQNELMKIQGFPTSNTVTVLRAQDGAGVSTTYNNGDGVTAIGFTSLISSEVWKDFTGVSTSFRVTNPTGFTTNNYIKIDNEFMRVTGKSTDQFGLTTVILAEEKPNQAFDEQNVKVRYLYSQARLTGHDFLQIGTGGTATTNWPGLPINRPLQTNEITEGFPGRVFYVSTDQDGNFRVGKYFRINQATGSATLNASAFDLSGLTSLRLGSIGAQLGAQINEFSSDGTLSQNSNEKVPTQAAVKFYVDTNVSQTLEDSKIYTYFIGRSS